MKRTIQTSNNVSTQTPNNVSMHRTVAPKKIVVKGGLLYYPPSDCPWKDMGGRVVDVTICEFFCNQNWNCEKYRLLQEYLRKSRKKIYRKIERCNREKNEN